MQREAVNWEPVVLRQQTPGELPRHHTSSAHRGSGPSGGGVHRTSCSARR